MATPTFANGLVMCNHNLWDVLVSRPRRWAQELKVPWKLFVGQGSVRFAGLAHTSGCAQWLERIPCGHTFEEPVLAKQGLRRTLGHNVSVAPPPQTHNSHAESCSLVCLLIIKLVMLPSELCAQPGGQA